MISPQTVSNGPRRRRAPSVNPAAVTAWQYPLWVLVCQPVNTRWDADGVPAVDITPLLLVVVSDMWWAGPVVVGGRQATAPAMAIDGRHDHGRVLPKQ
jgi:hypothetical protein